MQNVARVDHGAWVCCPLASKSSLSAHLYTEAQPYFAKPRGMGNSLQPCCVGIPGRSREAAAGRRVSAVVTTETAPRKRQQRALCHQDQFDQPVYSRKHHCLGSIAWCASGPAGKRLELNAAVPDPRAAYVTAIVLIRPFGRKLTSYCVRVV